MKGIAYFLQRITMYRLMLYVLTALIGIAIILSFVGVLPYSPWDILIELVAFIAVCWVSNTVIARVLKIQTNVESVYITAFILVCIAGPLQFPQDFLVLLTMGIAAMASKYIFVVRRSHIFNPAACGVMVSALLFGYPASWWIGSLYIFPVILIGGALITQKIRRWHLVFSFLGVYLGLLAIDALLFQGHTLSDTASFLGTLITSSSLLFFSFIMLLEPLTAPQTRYRRIIFGIVVACIVFGFQRFVSSIPYSLELSLLIGNIVARILSPDFRQKFALQRKQLVGTTLGHFWFRPSEAFSFVPGQFLEYTLAHTPSDTRGIRRYYTIASSPTEQEILLTTKFPEEKESTFKKSLQAMGTGSEIVASKVAGDFTLPSDPSTKLAFIAGGIGITPFRSMVKYLLDTGEQRDIVLLYAVKQEGDIVFQDIFEEAQKTFGMRTVYIVSQLIDGSAIKKEVSDFLDRVFYISGPEQMVEGSVKMLRRLGIPQRRIMRDYFPGYDS